MEVDPVVIDAQLVLLLITITALVITVVLLMLSLHILVPLFLSGWLLIFKGSLLKVIRIDGLLLHDVKLIANDGLLVLTTCLDPFMLHVP